MENRTQCWEVVQDMIQKVTPRLSVEWCLNEEKAKILQEYCDSIDVIAERFDGLAYGAEMNREKKTVSVVLDCLPVTVFSDERRFYDLVERSINVSFSSTKEGDLSIMFVFPSVWDRV